MIQIWWLHVCIMTNLDKTGTIISKILKYRHKIFKNDKNKTTITLRNFCTLKIIYVENLIILREYNMDLWYKNEKKVTFSHWKYFYSAITHIIIWSTLNLWPIQLLYVILCIIIIIVAYTLYIIFECLLCQNINYFQACWLFNKLYII